MLTGVNEPKHDHAWWQTWWAENKDRLAWNREEARFETKKSP